MSKWYGRVFAPSGISDFPREFDGESPSEILLSAASELDAHDADKVTVEMVNWQGSEWTPWRHDGHFLDILWSVRWDGLYHAIRCPKAAGRQCMMEPDGCMLREQLASAGLEFFTSGLKIPDDTSFSVPLALQYRVRDSHGEDDDEFLEIRPLGVT